MSDVHSWSTTAASNNSASPDGWPENMAPSSVNNSARENMAALAKWYKDQQGTLVTAGTTSAYTLTTNTVYTNLNQLPLLVMEFNAANAVDATLNVDGLGAKTLKKGNNTNLAANDILINQRVAVIYNADNDTFEVVSAVSDTPTGTLHSSGTLAPHANLVVKNGTTAASQVTVTADEVLVSDGTTTQKLTSVSVANIDVTVSGAGGLDTGAEAASTWYYLYVIWGAGQTTSAVLSTVSAVATGPTKPANYTHWGLVGAVHNNASSNFRTFNQKNNYVIQEDTTLISGTGTFSTSLTEIDTLEPGGANMARVLPVNATRAHGFITITHTVAGTFIGVGPTSTNAYGERYAEMTGTSGTAVSNWETLIITAQTLFYRVSLATVSGTTSIHSSGWVF